jgi:hypothetical protein
MSIPDYYLGGLKFLIDVEIGKKGHFRSALWHFHGFKKCFQNILT